MTQHKHSQTDLSLRMSVTHPKSTGGQIEISFILLLSSHHSTHFHLSHLLALVKHVMNQLLDAAIAIHMCVSRVCLVSVAAVVSVLDG